MRRTHTAGYAKVELDAYYGTKNYDLAFVLSFDVTASAPSFSTEWYGAADDFLPTFPGGDVDGNYAQGVAATTSALYVAGWAQ